MFIFRHGARAAQLSTRTRPLLHRTYASRIDIPFAPPPIPIIERCPAPTCPCGESPPGLDIEREQNINGSMPTYAEHVVIGTGKQDWTSRIEDDESSILVRQLKGLVGKGGKYSDPYHNVLLTNSSFATSPPEDSFSTDPAYAHDTSQAKDQQTTPPASAYILPSFTYIPSIPTSPASVTEAFLQAFLLPTKLHSAHAKLSPIEQAKILRQPELQASHFPAARPIEEILILICSHNSRDSRCGTLGPLLKTEFEDKLQRQNIPLLSSASGDDASTAGEKGREYSTTARVGLISHIGGHKWAGNVIIYIPPSFTRNPLAGKGIWYGRVGPEHVEGIVAKTVLEGKVVKELFRGGIGKDGEMIRL